MKLNTFMIFLLIGLGSHVYANDIKIGKANTYEDMLSKLKSINSTVFGNVDELVTNGMDKNAVKPWNDYTNLLGKWIEDKTKVLGKKSKKLGTAFAKLAALSGNLIYWINETHKDLFSGEQRMSSADALKKKNEAATVFENLAKRAIDFKNELNKRKFITPSRKNARTLLSTAIEYLAVAAERAKNYLLR